MLTALFARLIASFCLITAYLRKRPFTQYTRPLLPSSAQSCGLIAVLLMGCLAFPLSAQQPAAAEQKKALENAATAGAPLPTSVNVDSSVNIEAVMLPSSVAKRVFGSEVAKNYAVIEVNISNRSSDAGFILQSLFIDYSHWAMMQPLALAGIAGAGQPYQSKASTQEVSSVEYRIVRGEMLDQQPWTRRNFGLRSIKTLGAIGTSFAFPFSRDVVKGIGAWNGAVVPGFEALFPDGMEGQLSRVSDYGFRNNKVIPQQSSDIVIAFFPIDRFLSPSLKQIFLDSPSLFFNPFLMAIDPQTRDKLSPILINVFHNQEEVDKQMGLLLTQMAALDPQQIADDKDVVDRAEAKTAQDTLALAELVKNSGVSNETEKKQLDDGLTTLQTKLAQEKQDVDAANRKLLADTQGLRSNQLFRFLSQIALSNVNIVVSGIMTVDEQTIPATIEATCFDGAGADLWAVAGKKQCFIKGKYLADGSPKIIAVQPADLGISNITVDRNSSTSELLNFSFDLAKPLSAATVDVVVTKTDHNGKTVDSMKYRQSSAYTLVSPSISNVSTDESAVTTVTGSGFYSNPENPFSLSFRNPTAGKDDKNDISVLTSPPSDPKKISLSPTDVQKVTAGCYEVVIKVGTREADAPEGQVARVDPSVDSVTRTDNKITISIGKIAAIASCDKALSFVFLDSSGKNAATKKLSEGQLDGSKVSFDLGTTAQAVVKAGLQGHPAVDVK